MEASASLTLRHRAFDRLADCGTGSWTPRGRIHETLRGIVEADETYLPSKPERRAEHGPAAQAAAEKRIRVGFPRISRRSCSPRTGRARPSGRRWTRRGRRKSRTRSVRPWRRMPCWPTTRRVAALRKDTRVVPRRSEPIRRTANPGSLPHPDGRQPAKPLKEIPVPLPRRRDEISRKLPSVMPTRLPRRKRRRVNLPRSRRQFAMHTNRKMSQEKWLSAVPPLRANRSDRAGFRPIACKQIKMPERFFKHAWLIIFFQRRDGARSLKWAAAFIALQRLGSTTSMGTFQPFAILPMPGLAPIA